MMPPNTWYTPLYCIVPSTAITSLTFSTTQTVAESLDGLEQTGHNSVSDMLWQRRQ